MFSKLRFMAAMILVAVLSLVWTSTTLSTARGDVRSETLRGETPVQALEPSDCLGMFDVWTNAAGSTFIGYFGRDLPRLDGGSATLNIWIDSSWWGGWVVRNSTYYDSQSLGKKRGKWVYVELRDGGFTRCSGYYQA